MAVEVDQSSGVGTLIQPGDRVDMVIAFNITEYLPQPATGPACSQLPVPLPSQPVSVKDILQNLEVLGTLDGAGHDVHERPDHDAGGGRSRARPSDSPASR